MGRTSRLLALVLLALQAMLWIGGPIVDGRQEASSARTPMHVEELGGSKCPKVHSHLDCLICRTLSDGAVTATPGGLLPVVEVASGVLCGRATAIAIPSTVGSLGSRAPPRA